MIITDTNRRFLVEYYLELLLIKNNRLDKIRHKHFNPILFEIRRNYRKIIGQTLIEETVGNDKQMHDSSGNEPYVRSDESIARRLRFRPLIPSLLRDSY